MNSPYMDELLAKANSISVSPAEMIKFADKIDDDINAFREAIFKRHNELGHPLNVRAFNAAVNAQNSMNTAVKEIENEAN